MHNLNHPGAKVNRKQRQFSNRLAGGRERSKIRRKYRHRTRRILFDLPREAGKVTGEPPRMKNP